MISALCRVAKFIDRAIVAAGLALVACGSVVLAAELPDALARCAAETDDARRLSCYDTEVRHLRSGPAATPDSAIRNPTTTDGTASGAVSGAAVANDPVRTSEDEFGRRADPRRDESPEERKIEAAVTRISRRSDGGLVLTLDNGQIWGEISPNASVRIQEGNRVKIERGAFGSYLLVAPNKRSSKVTRLQ